MEKNESNHYRGLHVVIINTLYGTVELAKVFDTYRSCDSFDEFCSRDIPENYIIIAACKDDCANSLS